MISFKLCAFIINLEMQVKAISIVPKMSPFKIFIWYKILRNTQNTTGADNAIICKLALIFFNAKTKAMSALNPLAQKNNFNSRCLKS